MASTYDIGDLIRVTAIFTDTGGVKQDPTVLFVKRPPLPSTSISYNYSTSSTTIIRASSGTYYVDILSTGSGDYTWRFTATGIIQATTQSAFHVKQNLA